MPYTRASSLADYITYLGHVRMWEKRYLTKGMGLRVDLAMLASAETYTTGFAKESMSRNELRANSASGRRLDEIAERALDHVGIHEKADRGTAIHALTEPGAPVEQAHPGIRDSVDAFWRVVKECGIRLLSTETFTACDETMSAGTFDHLVDAPGYGVVIGDKKRGDFKAHQFGIQLGTYANSEVYDWETDERADLESLSGGEAINRSTGLIFLISEKGCEIHELNLSEGYAAAKTAAAARDYHATTGLSERVDGLLARRATARREQLMADLNAADGKQGILDLYELNKHLWTKDHTARARELAG